MINRAEHYSSGLMSEAPWFHEFKKMVLMVHDDIPMDEIKRRCVNENLFGMPKEYRALRTFGSLLTRIRVMDKTLINLFCESDLATQKLINCITVIKSDKLFSEMINEVYREKAILGYKELALTDINVFFSDKTIQDEEMKKWKDTTFKRLRSSYFQFLSDANLLRKEGNKYTITPPVIDIALERYLQYNGEEYILKAITGVR